MILKLIHNVLTLFGVIFILFLGYAALSKDTKRWNKEVGVDTVQKFTMAYLTTPDRGVIKMKIVSWRDFELSDQLQFTDDKGVSYMTHASRVILTNED